MTLSEKNWASDKSLFDRVVEIAFYVSKNIVWGINVFFKKTIFLKILWDWAKNFQPLATKFFLQDCQKCNLRVYGITLRKIYFCEKNLWTFHRWTLGEKVPVCWQKNFSRIVKPLHVEPKFSGFLSKKISKLVKTAFYVCTRST